MPPTPVHHAPGPRSSTPRISDVARRARVSPATVSRVLNGSTSVATEYRQRVEQAIEELGYRPNLLARHLRRQQAEMIGMLVADIENPHFTAMVRAVEDAAYHLGYRLLLCNTDETPEKQRAYLEMLAAAHVLGVVLSTSNPHGREIADLLDQRIPVVAFDRPVADQRADSVFLDNYAAGTIATQHLILEGHRRIGFVSSPSIGTGIQRLRAYEDSMRDAGLPTFSANGISRIDGGAAAARELLATQPNLSALIVGNNLMTIGTLTAIRQSSLVIPRDIAVVAIDDPFWAQLVDPPLTTLAQPVRKMADSVVELLMERLHGRSEPRHLMFQPELQQRASCGPHPLANPA